MNWNGGQKKNRLKGSSHAATKQQKRHFANIRRKSNTAKPPPDSYFTTPNAGVEHAQSLAMKQKQLSLDGFRAFKPVIERLHSMTPRPEGAGRLKTHSPNDAFSADTLSRQHSKTHVTKGADNYPLSSTALAQSSDRTETAKLPAHSSKDIDLNAFRYQHNPTSNHCDSKSEQFRLKRKALLEQEDWAGLAPSRPARFNFSSNVERGTIGKRRRVTEDDRRRREGYGQRVHVPPVEERYFMSGALPTPRVTLEEVDADTELREGSVARVNKENLSDIDIVEHESSSTTEGHELQDSKITPPESTKSFTSGRSVYEMFLSNPFDLSDRNCSDTVRTAQDSRNTSSTPKKFQEPLPKSSIRSSPPPVACTREDGLPTLILSSPNGDKRKDANEPTQTNYPQPEGYQNDELESARWDAFWNSYETRAEEPFQDDVREDYEFEGCWEAEVYSDHSDPAPKTKSTGTLGPLTWSKTAANGLESANASRNKLGNTTQELTSSMEALASSSVDKGQTSLTDGGNSSTVVNVHTSSQDRRHQLKGKVSEHLMRVSDGFL